MCGIIGYYNPEVGVVNHDAWQKALKAQKHRGPDHCESWMDDDGCLSLGHNRLAIIDCSPTGYQPMLSPSGRYVITYNGEIYNFVELKKELSLSNSNYAFKGGSDTEVLLAAIEEWGLEKALSRCIGMFAFGLWDKQKKKLHLVRDRLGIKPLYYGIIDGKLAFASELKPIQIIFKNRLSINYDAISLFFKKLYIPAPYSIYNEIQKIKPGEIVSCDLGGQNKLSAAHNQYWDINGIVAQAKANPVSGDYNETIAKLETLLEDAVAKRMRSDVPYGAFLSGGIDSSLVVSLMQKQSPDPINTFSIGFEDDSFDESKFASRIAEHLGTNHHELYVDGSALLKVIPSLSDIYDEPFADASQIPTFIVSKLARQNITVALSGDGGDELFGGYERYFRCSRTFQIINHIPTWMRRFIRYGLKISGRELNGGRLSRLHKILEPNEILDFYLKMISVWPSSQKITGGEDITGKNTTCSFGRTLSFLEQFMLEDSQSYLPDDILTKVDRASMANSLEVRVPILDHRVFEWAWRMPLELKIFGGVTKWPLRKILSKHIPKHLYERPKQGFSPPLEQWLRNDLKQWSGDLIHASYLKNGFELNYKPVQKMWKQHQSGSLNRSYYLWPAVMLSDWLAKNHI